VNRIVFLGTGCGGLPMLLQKRRTGGIYLELDRKKFIIDPGPGCIVNAKEIGLNPQKWEYVLLSHYHFDHSVDINPILDSLHMCVLIAERHCLSGKNKCISEFVQANPRKIYAVKAGSNINLGKIRIKTTQTDHYAPCVGFKICGSKVIGYTADTSYFKGIEKEFESCDVLIANTLEPIGSEEKEKWHMNIDGLIKMVKKIKNKPKLLVIRHFGSAMLEVGPETQAEVIEDLTKIKTIAAKDFMQIDIDTLAGRGKC